MIAAELAALIISVATVTNGRTCDCLETYSILCLLLWQVLKQLTPPVSPQKATLLRPPCYSGLNCPLPATMAKAKVGVHHAKKRSKKKGKHTPEKARTSFHAMIEAAKANKGAMRMNAGRT
jgi:hypothetical protein